MSKLPQPLRARGASTLRWESWRTKQRAQVSARARGRCEIPHCPNPAQEWHHTMGRRHIIGEPLASHHTFGAGICAEHHREVTRTPGGFVDEQLKRAAIERAERWFGVHTEGDLEGRARALEDALKASGEWDRLREQAGVP